MVRLRSFLSCSVCGPARHDSNAALVDAAHAVDGDLLDEQFEVSYVEVTTATRAVVEDPEAPGAEPEFTDED